MDVFKCFKCQRVAKSLGREVRKECTIEVDGIDLVDRMVNCPLTMEDVDYTIEAEWELVE